LPVDYAALGITTLSYPKTKGGKRIINDTTYSIDEMVDLIKKSIPTSSNSCKRDRALFAILATFGMRVSELTSIRKKDVNYSSDSAGNKKTITINIHTAKNPSQKTRRPQPTIRIYKPLIDLFDAWLDELDKEELVFPISDRWVWFLCKKYFGRTFSPHWFRHYAASYLARLGLPPSLLQKYFGWSVISSAAPYLHLNQEDVSDFLEGVANKQDVVSKPVEKKLFKKFSLGELE